MTNDGGEVARVRDVFGRYDADSSLARRWDPELPGNVFMERERDVLVQRLLAEHRLWPPTEFRTLDLGCGSGRVMETFAGWGTKPEEIVGLDVVEDRLKRARAMRPTARLVEGDAASLGFATGAFSLVVLYTVLSSVPHDLLPRIAAEISRVLDATGSVLLYDYRVSHPLNRNTRRISRRTIGELFVGYDADLRATTLVPQIARRLGSRHERSYDRLASVPFLRTHYVGLLRKRSRG